MSRTKRFLAMLLVICMVASMVPGNVFAADTAQSIQTAQDLLTVMNNAAAAGEPLGNCNLLADIDLGGAELPAVALTGTFNGNSKTISNAKIVNADTNGNMGFFSTVAAGAQVLNLNLKNVTVDTTGAGAANAKNVGIFAGLAESGATIIGGQKLKYTFIGQGKGKTTVNVSSAAYSAEVILNLTEGTTIGLVGSGEGASVSGAWRQLFKEQSSTIEARREAAAKYMMDLGTIKWKTTADRTIKIGSDTLQFNAGVTYYGIPYNHVASSLEQAKDIIDPSTSKLKNYVVNAGNSTWGEDLGFSRYFGADCSSSVSLAWNSVSPLNRGIGGVLVHETKWLVPTVRSRDVRGIIPVGYAASRNGRSGEDISTGQILEEIGGKEAVWEAYAQTRQGDVLVTYEPGVGGHARMAAQDPVVVRNADGSINGEESFFLVHEQGFGTVTSDWLTQLLGGNNTTWSIHEKLTFEELANKGGSGTKGYYLPITMKGFLQDEYAEAPSVKADNIIAPNAGKITSKYKILKAELSMKDSQGNPVSLKNTYGPDGTTLVVYNGVDGVANTYRGSNEYMDLSTHFANCLEDLAVGEYTYTIKAVVSGGSGEELTVVENKVYRHGMTPELVIESHGVESGAWTSKDVVLACSIEDADMYGPVTYQYRVNNGEWQDYTQAIIHTEDTDGVAYSFKAVTQSGAECVENFIVRKETTKPSNVVVKYDGENSFMPYANKLIVDDDNNKAKFFTDSVTVSITANDEGSGISEITYKAVGTDGNVVKEGKLTEADNFEVRIDGDFVGNIQVVSVVDKAGNRLNVNYKTENFVVEKFAPTGITANAKVDGKDYVPGTIAEGAITFTVSGATAASGIAEYLYSTDDGVTWNKFDESAIKSTAATAKAPATVTEAVLVVDKTVNGDIYKFKAISKMGREIVLKDTFSVFVNGDDTPEWTDSDFLPRIGKYKLATDVNVTDDTGLFGNLVLDLNGYTITRTVNDGVNEACVYKTSDKNNVKYALTIKDSSENQTGLIKMVPATAGAVHSSNIAVVYANGVFTLDGGTLDNTAMITNFTDANSGTVTVSGKFIMNGGVIKGQKNTSEASAATGSAIGVRNDGSVTINGGEVYGWKDPADVAAGKTGSALSTACKNGTVIAGGKNYAITINGGELHGSKASTHGGVIYTGANVYINGGLIADGYGSNHGGVYCSGAELVITGGTIKNNSNGVAANGNNIFKDNGTLTISGGTIGGGISIKGGKMVLSGKPAIGEIEGTLYRADLLIVGTAGSIHIGSAESAAVQTAEGKYDVACDAEGNITGVVPFVQKWKDNASLPTSGTYKLTTDVNVAALNDEMKIQGDLDIDLNGYTITGTVPSNKTSGYLFRNAGYNLTIRDSSAAQTGTMKMVPENPDTVYTSQIAAVEVNKGTFTLEGGTLDNTAMTCSYTAYCGAVTINGGTFTMNGGVIKGQKNTSATGGSAIGIRNNASTITINGGKVYGWTDPAEADKPAAERSPANNNGSVIMAGTTTTITINGGELYGSNTKNQGTVIYFVNSGSSVNIKGGKIYGGYVDGQYGAELYTKSINGIKINDTIVSKVAANYFVVKNEEGLTTSLVEAWTTADSLPVTGTYKLATDVNVTANSTKKEYELTGDLDLDLNGYTITSTVATGQNEAYIYRDSGYNLIIRDSSEGKTGTMKMVPEAAGTVCASQISAVYVTGKTTLEGGTLDNTAMISSHITFSGTVTVNGGAFIMNGGVIKGQKNEGNHNNCASAIGIRTSKAGSVTINGGKVYGWMDPTEVAAGKTGSQLTAACNNGSVINAEHGAITINGGELYAANTKEGGTAISLYNNTATLDIRGGKIYGGYVGERYGAELRTRASAGTIQINGETAASGKGMFFIVKNEEGVAESLITGWTEAASLPTSGTYKLATDVATNATTKLEGTLVLDLNGHTITRTVDDGVTTDEHVFDQEEKALTIRDSSANQTGIIKMVPATAGNVYSGVIAAVYANGLFTLEGGTIDNTAMVTSYKGANSGAVTVSNAFIMNGGVIKGQQNTGNVSNATGSAIGMRNNATLVVEGGKIYGWKAAGEENLTGSALTKNASATGTAITAGTGTSITIKSGELHGSKAVNHGGVIYSLGNVYVEGGLITGGYAKTASGGIYCSSTGEMVISGGTIKNNENHSDNALKGNNIIKDKGTLTISGGTIGGGIGISGTDGKLVLTGTPKIGEIEGTLYRADLLISDSGKNNSIHIGSADSEAVQTAQGKYEVVYDDDGNVVDVIAFTAKKWTDATKLPTSGTYKLTTDVNVAALNDEMKIQGDLDIDLNGYTITGTVPSNKTSGYLFRNAGYNLTIRDSSAAQTGTMKMVPENPDTVYTSQIAAVEVNKGTFTLEGGTLDNTAMTCSYTAYCGAVTINGGTFTMNGGVIKGQKNTSATGGSAIGIRNNASTITINGGKVYGWTDPAEADKPAAERSPANNNGSVIMAGTTTTITINGGELYGSNTKDQGTVIYFVNSGSSVNIKGGKIYGGYVNGHYGAELYTKSINGIKINDTIVSKVAANYFVVKNEEGLTTSVAQAWTTADGLPTSGTYKLATDVNVAALNDEMKIKGDLDIDLNGHTITGTVPSSSTAGYLFRNAGYNLTIRDSSVAQTGTMKMVPENSNTVYTSQIAAVEVNKGTFTLEGGTLDNTAMACSYTAYCGAVTINGGTFTMNGGVIKGQKNTSTTGGSAIGIRNNASTITINGGKVYGWTDPAEADMPAANRSPANNNGSVIMAGIDTTITINGGELYGSNTKKQGTVIYFVTSGSSVNIKGGKIYGGYVDGLYGAELYTKSINGIKINGTQAVAAAGLYNVVTDNEGNVVDVIVYEPKWDSATSLPTSGTYKLTTNVNINADANSMKLTGDLDLDLNGYTITGTINGDIEAYIFRTNGHALVIRDSSAGQTGTLKMQHASVAAGTKQIAAVLTDNGGTFTLEGGTLDNTAITTSHATFSGTVTVNGGAFIMNGGVIKGQKNEGNHNNCASAIGIRTSKDGSVTINGGKVYGWMDPTEVAAGKTGSQLTAACNNGSVINAQYGTITINGGELYAANTKEGGTAISLYDSTATLDIRGGKIYGGYVGEQYGAELRTRASAGTIQINGETAASGKGMFFIVKNEEGVAESLITGWTEAASLPKSGVVKLLTDVNVIAATTLTGELDLDLNGHTVTYTVKDGSVTNYAIKLGGQFMTLRDSSAGQTGTIKMVPGAGVTTCAGEVAVIYGNTSFVMEGGTLDNSAMVTSYASSNTGTVVLNNPGTTFTMKGGVIKGQQNVGTASGATGSAIGMRDNTILVVEGGKIYGWKAAGEENLIGKELTQDACKAGSVITAGAGTSITIKGGELHGSRTTNHGGVIYSKGNVYVQGGLITDAYAPNHGGIYCDSTGEVVITGGTIQNNFNDGSMGYNVYKDKGTLTVSGGTIGGGLCVTNGATMVITGTPVIKEVEGSQYSADLRIKDSGTIKLGDTTVATAAGKYFVGTNDAGAITSVILGWETKGALPTSGNVKLLTNVAVSADTKLEGTLVLDLNGHTITRTVNDGVNEAFVYKTSDENDVKYALTIKDGSEKQTGLIKMVPATADAVHSGNIAVVYANGVFTLDGGTIDNTAMITSYKGANSGAVTVSGTFIMNGGVIKGQQNTGGASSQTGSAIGAHSKGVITINGGKIYGWMDPADVAAGKTGAALTKAASACGTVITGGSTITINGGELYGSKAATHGGVIFTSANVYINGGLITGGYAGNASGGVYCSGTEMIITGGTIKNNANGSSYDFKGNNMMKDKGTLTISGGTIGGGVGINNAAKLILTGTPIIDRRIDNLERGDIIAGDSPNNSYICIDSADNVVITTEAKATYEVVEDETGKIIGVQKLSDVASDAVIYWRASDKLPTIGNVKLLTDVNVVSNATTQGTILTGDLVLDLNGHTITRTTQSGTVESYVYRTDKYSLTICDSSENETGLIKMEGVTPTSQVAAIEVKGTFILDGGTIDNSAMTSVYGNASSGAITVNGGAFVMKRGVIKGQKNTSTTDFASSVIGIRTNAAGSVTITGGKLYAWKDPAEVAAGKTGTGLTAACVNGTVINAQVGTITINGGEFYGSRAANAGGIIYTSGDLTINNVEISGGIASGNGKNIYCTGNAYITITDATIDGGVYIDMASVTISGNTNIVGNPYGLKLASGQVADFTGLTGKVSVDAEGVFTTQFASGEAAQAMLDSGRIVAGAGCTFTVNGNAIESSAGKITVGDEEYDSLAEAVKSANSGETVSVTTNVEEGLLSIPAGVTVEVDRNVDINVNTLIVDSNATMSLNTANVNVDTILIQDNGKLDLGESEVRVDMLHISDGAQLIGTPEKSKLHVEKDGVALHGTPADDGKYQIMPIWDPVEECYEFSRFMIQDEAKDGRGLTVTQTENGDVITFQFKHNATKALNKELLGKATNNTEEENAISIRVKLTWTSANGEEGSWDGYYAADLVREVASNYRADGGTPKDYVLRLTNLITSHDVEHFTIQAYVDFARGDYAVYGQEYHWYRNNAG